MPDYITDTPLGLDGYDRMEFVRNTAGWRPIPSWGRDGWDLGSWPYVTIMFKEADGKYAVREDVEGDVTIRQFETEQQRNAYVDTIAFYYWHQNKEDWVAGIKSADDMPPYLRGPFSWKRLEAERGVEA